MFEDALIERVRNAWSSYQTTGFAQIGRIVPRPLPSIAEVKRCVEACFLASFKAEEGRPVEFACAMVKQTDIANDAPYGHLKLHYPCDVHTFVDPPGLMPSDRKSTRLNSSHGYISYAVFCLKKKKKKKNK